MHEMNSNVLPVQNDAVNMYEDMAGFLLRTTETPDNTDALSKTSALMEKATT